MLTCPEPTYEGMCRLLAAGHPSIGIFAAEGGQYIGGHGMSDDARLRTAAGLSAAWTGWATGACPGYVRDHIVPLACGGPDAVQNMQ